MSATILVNGVERVVTATNIADLLRDENVDTARSSRLPSAGRWCRSKWDGAAINPGDDIEIVSPAPGG